MFPLVRIQDALIRQKNSWRGWYWPSHRLQFYQTHTPGPKQYMYLTCALIKQDALCRFEGTDPIELYWARIAEQLFPYDIWCEPIHVENYLICPNFDKPVDEK